MAMQTFHEAPQLEASAPVGGAVPEAPEIDQARVYAQEVRSLRQRVAVLEAELAAAKAAEQLSKTPPLTSIDFAPTTPAVKPAPPVLSQMVVGRPQTASVFTEQTRPAVVAVSPKPPTPESLAPATTPAPATPETAPAPPSAPATSAEPSEAQGAPVSNPGFAQAWSEEPDATFAEQVAEKAFFQATSIDEQSRNWLLES